MVNAPPKTKLVTVSMELTAPSKPKNPPLAKTRPSMEVKEPASLDLPASRRLNQPMTKNSANHANLVSPANPVSLVNPVAKAMKGVLREAAADPAVPGATVKVPDAVMLPKLVAETTAAAKGVLSLVRLQTAPNRRSSEVA